jgi:nicotinate-nucleotide--dimethylbenzimidazole phosphoribosyltransferase
MIERIQSIIGKIKPIEEDVVLAAVKQHDAMAIPKGSLGRLHELSIKVVGIAGSLDYTIRNKVIAVMAGDHGVAEEGVSLFPQEVTGQMVENFLRGDASISALARHAGARVVVVDMGVNGDIPGYKTRNAAGANRFVCKKIGRGTANIAKGPAMTREEALRTLCAGMEVFEEEATVGVDIVGTGDMGIANTTPSAAIACAVTGMAPEEVVGHGTGLDEKGRTRKVGIVKQVLSVNEPDLKDPVDILAKVGGYEIGGLTGWILAACTRRVPVVIDGFISTAAALLAVKLSGLVRDYLIAGHRSREKGHALCLEFLRLDPVLDLDMRLGEGTGAALAMGIVEAASKLFHEVASFSDAKVTDPGQ